MKRASLPATRRPIIRATEAQLFVADVAASCAYYRETLGFTVAFMYGEPPYYAQVKRGGARLNLRAVGEPVFAGNIRERESLLSASLTVATSAEIEGLYTTFENARAQFRQRIREETWGARTFIVRDPDGNLILFASPL